MKEDVLFSMPIMIWVFAGMHLIFMYLFFSEFRKARNILMLLSGLVTVGLFCDSLTLSLGTIFHAGGLLKGLNKVAFICQGAFIPLILPICAYSLNLKGIVKRIVWVLTGLVSILGIAGGVMTHLEKVEIAGISRYAEDVASASWVTTVGFIINYGTAAVLMLVGVIILIKQKTTRVLLSGILMFLFLILGPITGNDDISFFVSMIGEIFMIFYLLMYARFRENRGI